MLADFWHRPECCWFSYLPSPNRSRSSLSHPYLESWTIHLLTEMALSSFRPGVHNPQAMDLPGVSDGKEFACNAGDAFPGQEDPLEKGMTTRFGILAWRIPWTEEPGELQCVGSQRVEHNPATCTFTFCDPQAQTGTWHWSIAC